LHHSLQRSQQAVLITGFDFHSNGQIARRHLAGNSGGIDRLAAKLAQQHRELELAGRAVDFLSGPFQDGSIEITAPQAAEVLQTEKKERAYHKGNRGPNYRSIVGELDEFDFEDDDEFEDDFAVFDPDDPFSGCQIPEDMPPEVARFLLEETKRAVLRGESLEQLMARLTARGMLPDQAHKKNRRGRGE
jgi:hypothetical protein